MSAPSLRMAIAGAMLVFALIAITPAAQAQTAAPPDPAQGMSEEELRLRIELLRRSMGFGGIFGPAFAGLAERASPLRRHRAGSMRPLNEYAVRRACANGDLWGADRIEQGRASEAERA
jgi:hypothetical protein